MRRLQTPAALLATALILTMIPARAAVDEAQARRAGEAAVQTVIPRKMDYQRLKLGLLPFSARVSNLTISATVRPSRVPVTTSVSSSTTVSAA